MADQGQILRGIDFRSVFPFVHIFRSFRIAIDPSKLGLAVAALVLLLFGGLLLDKIWPDAYRVVPGSPANNEVALYEQTNGNFGKVRSARYDAHMDDARDFVRALGLKPKDNATPIDFAYQVKTYALETRQKGLDDIAKRYADKTTAEQIKQRDDEIERVYSGTSSLLVRAQAIKMLGIGATFARTQYAEVNHLTQAIRDMSGREASGAIWNLVVIHPTWLVQAHPIYAVLFVSYLLLILAIFGGAISRIAAIQVARDEKISIRAALKFSTGKVLSFIFAPVIPLAIIAIIIGVVAIISGIIGWVPFIGPVVIGAGAGIALLAGMVLTLTAIGLVGGGNLMYPSIAIEGSDSFDAVSRSFSYVYDRPWHMAFYSLVALVYGTITYLFVRLFAYMLLALTRTAVGLLIFTHARDGTYSFEQMWPKPHYEVLNSPYPDMSVLGSGEAIGAWFINLWVSLVILIVIAFLVSMYFTCNTVIYYLMRKDVDATDLDEVYVEPSDEEFSEPAAEPEAPASESSATASASSNPGAPSDTPPGDGTPA